MLLCFREGSLVSFKVKLTSDPLASHPPSSPSPALLLLTTFPGPTCQLASSSFSPWRALESRRKRLDFLPSPISYLGSVTVPSLLTTVLSLCGFNPHSRQHPRALALPPPRPLSLLGWVRQRLPGSLQPRAW